MRRFNWPEVHDHLLEIALRATEISTPDEAGKIIREALARISDQGCELLGTDSPTTSSLFIAMGNWEVVNTIRDGVLPRMARPPTCSVVPVAIVSDDPYDGILHQTAFRVRLHRRLTFGRVPTDVAGTPAELYDLDGATPESVYVRDVNRWRFSLLASPHDPTRDTLTLAMLQDLWAGRVRSLRALPLISPWTDASDRTCILRGHVLLTSSEPGDESRAYLTQTQRDELATGLGTIAEICSIACSVLFPGKR